MGLGFGVWGSNRETSVRITEKTRVRTNAPMKPSQVCRQLGFRAWGLGFGVWGLGFRVWGLGFRVWGLGFGV